MTTSLIAQTQSNIAEHAEEERVIVELTNSSESSGGEETMCETGLLRISSVKRLRDEDKKLRKDFLYWMPKLPKIKRKSRQMQTKTVKFNDAAECTEYVKICGRQRVVLILSGHHVHDKKLIKTFKRCPQVAMIYRRISQKQFQQQSERWFFDGLFSDQSRLSKKIIGTPAKNLDQAGQRQLIEIALNESIPKQPLNVEEAKQHFITFCRSKYNGNALFLRQIDNFEANYHEEDAINWYTKPICFVNYVVSETCAAFSITNYSRIRFILHDLYLQLQKLHDEQSSMWPDTLIVHRGKAIPRIELDQLPKVGECVMTRGFLSVSTEEGVAEAFSSVGTLPNDSGQVSVIMSMHIDREEVASKPIVFISKYSRCPEEEEVLLPMGIVLRIDSYEEINNGNSQCLVKIKMICGKEEKEIEKTLSDSGRLVLGATATAAAGVAVGGAIFGLLKLLENEEDREEFGKVMADVYESTDPDLAAQIQDLTDRYNYLPAMVS